MNESELRAILAAAIKVDPESITDETSAYSTAGWDSLTAMHLTFDIEDVLGRQLTDDEIGRLTSWPYLKAICGIGPPQPFHKVLVLDADGTLWEGTAGETSLAHRIDRAARWRALQDRGVLLALCSRNEPSIILPHLGTTPESLRREEFVAVEIGWGSKVESLRKIAATLNVGVDSLVFVDDSPFEREAVRSQLGITVAEPDDDLEPLFPQMVDTSKTEQYRALAAAEQTRPQFASEEDYLRSLGIVVTICTNREDEVPRIAELCQKVNQFNLTTVRHSEASVARLMEAGRILTLHYRDRFGDQGLVGVVILVPGRGWEEKVDTFLLSCRVLGRGVEWAPWASGMILAATYFPTDRNGQVADFWERLGLRETEDGDWEGGPTHPVPDWIEVRRE